MEEESFAQFRSARGTKGASRRRFFNFFLSSRRARGCLLSLFSGASSFRPRLFLPLVAAGQTPPRTRNDPLSLARFVSEERASARGGINHRVINNRYFSSNVYRVRFKCLVKTNLRLLFSPFLHHRHIFSRPDPRVHRASQSRCSFSRVKGLWVPSFSLLILSLLNELL